MNKKLLISLLCVLALVIIGAAVAIAMVQGGGGQTYTALVEEGDRYIAAGDYNKAIITLTKAVEMEPGNVEAYTALSRAYEINGDKFMALKTLSDGYAFTGHTALIEQMRRIDPEDEYRMNPTVIDAASDLAETQNQTEDPYQDKSETAALNTELLYFVASASFNDYRLKFGGVNTNLQSSVCSVTVTGLDVTLRFFDTSSDRVINASIGQPYNEKIPNEVVPDSVAAIFGVRTLTFEDLRVMRGVTELRQDGNKITFRAYGCDVTVMAEDDGVIRDAASILIIPTGESTGSGEYRLTGRVVDAAMGSVVTGATLKIYEGTATYGDCIETVTDSTGKYSVNLMNSGTHTVVISKLGYIQESFEIYMSSGGGEMTKDFAISSELSGDQIRLVLTWSSSPRDLDSYLTGTTGSGTHLDVNFMSKIASNNGVIIARLDVDDMDGYGPETITLNDTSGSYEYYIHDFMETSTMAYSGAEVKIYKGNSLLYTVDVPSGVVNGWSVCTIQNGEVTLTNRAR